MVDPLPFDARPTPLPPGTWPNEDGWATRREAATYARVHISTISTAVARRQIAHVRVGNRRSLRFRKEWVDAWLQRGFREADAA